MAVGGYIYSHNSKIRTGLNSGLFNGLEIISQVLFYNPIFFILLNNNSLVKSRHSGRSRIESGRSPDGLQLIEKTGLRLSPE